MKKSRLFGVSLALCLGLYVIATAQNKPLKVASQDVPLKVTIEGNPNAPGSDRIVGDGRDYVDGQEGVYARFQVDNGSNDFNMNPTDKVVKAPRAVWFDFSSKIADGTVANPWFGKGLTQINSFLNFDQVYTVPVDPYNAYLRLGGFGQLTYSHSQTIYKVVFQPESTDNYTVVNTPNYVAFLEVRHPDCNTWIITPQIVSYGDFGYGSGSGAVSALIVPFGPSTGQYLMPFKITLTRLTPVSTCS